MSEGISERIRADRAALSAAFPACFQPAGARGNKHPIKIGIHRDVLERGVLDGNGAPLSAKRIRRAIADYCRGPKYARGMTHYQHRVGLDGKIVEKMAADHPHVLLAKTYLDKRKKQS